jgi:hypothetical protein
MIDLSNFMFSKLQALQQAKYSIQDVNDWNIINYYQVHHFWNIVNLIYISFATFILICYKVIDNSTFMHGQNPCNYCFFLSFN